MSGANNLLEHAPLAGFHIAEEIRTAGCAEDRARIVLRIPDLVLLQMKGALSRACSDTDFALGEALIDARVAALCAVRTEAGGLPATVASTVYRYQRLARMLAEVSDDD